MESKTRPINSKSFSPSTQRAKRVATLDYNNWVWFEEQLDKSPIQPIANLGTGFIEYNPPQFVIDAYRDGLEDVEFNQYGPQSGMPAFKEVLAHANSPLLGRTIDPESEISVHSGASEGLLSTVMAFVDPGDEVILLEPVFSAYVLHIEFAQGTPRYVPLRPPPASESRVSSGNDWTLDLKELQGAITPRTKLIVLNNPHNPIGKVFTPEELQSIGDICVRNSVIMVADEVYSRLAFVPKFTPLTTVSPSIAANTLTVGSIGKQFNATGWRIGYVIGPAELIHAVQAAHFVLCYTTAGPVQKAAIQALKQADGLGWWEQNRAEVKSKVDSFCEVLDELDIPYSYPSGGYFVMAHTAGIRIPSTYRFPPEIACLTPDMRLCWFLINEVGVASIPGTTFYGPENASIGENYLRFGICKSTEGLELAKTRLRRLRSVLTDLENSG